MNRTGIFEKILLIILILVFLKYLGPFLWGFIGGVFKVVFGGLAFAYKIAIFFQVFVFFAIVAGIIYFYYKIKKSVTK